MFSFLSLKTFYSKYITPSVLKLLINLLMIIINLNLTVHLHVLSEGVKKFAPFIFIMMSQHASFKTFEMRYLLATIVHNAVDFT